MEEEANQPEESQEEWRQIGLAFCLASQTFAEVLADFVPREEAEILIQRKLESSPLNESLSRVQRQVMWSLIQTAMDGAYYKHPGG